MTVYDTTKVRSPFLDRTKVALVEQQLKRFSGVDMSTGDVFYNVVRGELDGSWDARIGVLPQYEEWFVNKNGKPERRICEPYLIVEASLHKAFLGHNVYGGPTEFQQACSDLVVKVEELLGIELPPARLWTVHRVDGALMYRLSKDACVEFFRNMKLVSFPRRKRGTSTHDMSYYVAGKTTTVKFYHKGTEFLKHDKGRVRRYFERLFRDIYGEWVPDEKKPGEKRWVPDYEGNKKRAERKAEAMHRLADSRLRVEVEIHSDKLQYDFGKNPTVAEVTDAYLQQVYDAEIEKLLREGKQAMDTVKQSKAVLRRLQGVYGDSTGGRLYGFWTTLCTLGDEETRERFSKTVFYRNRKQLEDAGVSWHGTDVVVVANGGALPADFSPVRTDKRLCYLPARNREEYQVSREVMRRAA